MTSEPSTKSLTAERPSSKIDPPKDTKYNARLSQFDQIVSSARDLFKEKNEQYADGIVRTGVLGSVVSIAGLSARLEHLVLSAPDAGKSQEEAIVDIVKDLINYGVITGIMIMDDNWRPE
ncbi:hypothetical protein LCGC14_1790140 [marine sediment metagenome]|uniref:Nucleotide modification associated domain-containing protein n=1 Tax=marine sediment metagenome TaxID=412755 RepID=A0A0F9J7N3_9ZZZZ